MSQGIIFDIKRYAINDGPGIRSAVFLKGCAMKCWWCHNPEGQSSQTQLMFRSNRCKRFMACIDACPKKAIRWDESSITDWENCDHCGKCAEVCFSGAREMVGRSVSTGALMAEIRRDRPFYDQSGGGVTFTGGEPMMQVNFLQETLEACKAEEIHTTVDTCGYSAWVEFERIIPIVDLFLYDLKLMDDTRHKKYTSVSNQLILHNLQRLAGAKARIIVRMPLIPGINDDEGNIKLSAEFLRGLACLEGVEIMPYHEIGLAKYSALGMIYKLEGVKPALREGIRAAEQILEEQHLPVIKHDFGREE